MLTAFYGAVVASGGWLGYTSAGSKMSLIMGGAAGGILVLLALGKYLATRAGKSSRVYTMGSFAVAAVLAVVMGIRFAKTQQMVPAGAFAGVSLLSAAFYLLILSGRKVKRKRR